MMAKSTRKTRLKPPADITDEALLEWQRITSELAGLGLLANASRAKLVLYVESWAAHRAASRAVMKDGPVKTFNKGKTMGVHPAFKVMSIAATTCRRMLHDLGLSPAKSQTPEAQMADLEW